MKLSDPLYVSTCLLYDDAAALSVPHHKSSLMMFAPPSSLCVSSFFTGKCCHPILSRISDCKQLHLPHSIISEALLNQ